MSPFREGAHEGQGERKTLIRPTMGEEKIGIPLEAFRKSLGKEDVKWGTPEGKAIKTEWLLSYSESSPEVNGELEGALNWENDQLGRFLEKGDSASVLETIEKIKGLLDKLEKGVREIK
jgi:hypothetical protein